MHALRLQWAAFKIFINNNFYPYISIEIDLQMTSWDVYIRIIEIIVFYKYILITHVYFTDISFIDIIIIFIKK